MRLVPKSFLFLPFGANPGPVLGVGWTLNLVVDEVAEIVAEVEEDAVVLRHVGAARALGRAPVRLLPRHQEHVDIAAHREAEPLHVSARRLLLLGGAGRDVENPYPPCVRGFSRNEPPPPPAR